MAKVNLYIPDALLEAIDASAVARGLSRSAFVQEAASRYIASGENSAERLRRKSAGERALATMERIRDGEDREPGRGTLAVLRELRGAEDGGS